MEMRLLTTENERNVFARALPTRAPDMAPASETWGIPMRET